MSDHNSANASTTGTLTLLEAKKNRKQLERDTVILANRIKLLQLEEQKTWKRIEEARKKTDQIHNNRQRVEQKIEFKSKIQEERQKKLQEAKEHINYLRQQRKEDRERMRRNIIKDKQVAYKEVRAVRDLSVQRKYDFLNSVVEQNAQRSASVRNSTKRAEHKIKSHNEAKVVSATEEYWKRVEQEDKKKQEIEKKVMELELLEMELIKRLQNTQQVQKQAFTELESAINYRPSVSQ
jgi:hypothetical protein